MEDNDYSGALKYTQGIMEQLYSETPQLRESINPNSLKTLKATGSTLVEKAHGSSISPKGATATKASLYSKMRQLGPKKIAFGASDLGETGLGTMTVTTQQWRARYDSMKENVSKLREENKKLEEDIEKRQERYISREQEYRHTIEELQIALNRLTGLESNKARQEFVETEEMHKQIQDTLERLKQLTAIGLRNKESEIGQRFKEQIAEVKRQIDEIHQKNNEDQSDLLEKERKLKDLHQMTHLTEEIEEENRRLIKKNSELNIEYSSQDNDHTLLTHQLKMLKKDNIDLKRHLEELQQLAAMKPPKYEEDQKSVSHTSKHSSKISPKKPMPVQYSKFQQFEVAIQRLKKAQQEKKKEQRYYRTLYSQEIQSKIELEQLLRQCVDDVKAEIARKRSENKVLYYMSLRAMESPESAEISKKDREKIIEVLLSQERVLTLLYDKTFPPKTVAPRLQQPVLPEGIYNIQENQKDQNEGMPLSEFEEQIEKATGQADETEEPMTEEQRMQYSGDQDNPHIEPVNGPVGGDSSSGLEP